MEGITARSSRSVRHDCLSEFMYILSIVIRKFLHCKLSYTISLVDVADYLLRESGAVVRPSTIA